MHRIDLTTQKFGMLTVIALSDKRDCRNTRKWECRCECGNICYLPTSNLKQQLSCGCLGRPFIDITGQRFGRLLVLERSHIKCSQGKKWRCLCNCGSITHVVGTKLRAGSTQSCGCLLKERRFLPRAPYKTRSPAALAAAKMLIRNYKSGAKRRNLDWTLSNEDFISLTQQNCAYCDKPPSQKLASSQNGAIVYTGVDRADNTKGYTPDNVLPCCRQCNFAKGPLSVKEFVEWIKKVYLHLNHRRGSTASNGDFLPLLALLPRIDGGVRVPSLLK